MAEPKNPVAAALETAAPAPVTEEITGLPVQEGNNQPTPLGTIADILALRRADKPEKKDEPRKDGDSEKEVQEREKNKKLEDVDSKLREMLFKAKPKKSKAKTEDEPAKEVSKTDDEPEVARELEEVTPAPAPAKAPAKKVVLKDRAAEIRERELELEKQRLDLERQKLEMEKGRNQPTPKPEEDLSALSPDERYELEVFQVMAKTDQAKYGDLPKKFTDVARATARYKLQWEKDNPGETFNPDDSDHDAFFSKHQVRYDRKEFRRAENKLANEGAPQDPKIEQIEKTQREILAKEKVRELEPVIHKTWATHAEAMVEAIDPAILKAFKEGGKDKMLAEFPEESVEVMQAGEALSVVTQESYKLLEGDGLFEPSPGNRVHQRILETIRKQEAIIPLQPKADRLDPDGRDFATWEQWANMSPQQQSNHWHLGPEEVVDIISRDIAARVKYELDRINKIAESKIKRQSAPKGGDKPATVGEKPAERKSPATSPSTASKATVDTPAKSHDGSEDKFSKIIRSSLFKRSS